ncbi:MAG: hypothetical protein IPJ06_17100 [Saprospiraceae bacterium]|nr:hypothetical protein [Saprospiraceae bacterium]
MTDDVLDVLLHELDGATLVDPCNPNKPHQALMSELIESLCGGEYMGREDVLEALVSKDDIILTNSFVSNSVANCIYKRLLNTGLSNQTNLFCATFGSFLDSPDFDVYLMVGFPNAKARTYNNWPVNLPPTKSISIVIDQNYLSEEKDILIAKTIMHESIHAELYRVIAGIGGYSNLSPDNYPVIWEAYRDYKDWTHSVMAELYIGLLAEFLWEFDNKKFSLAHYQALAWEGLDGPADGHPVNTVWQSKSQAQKNAIQALRMALIDASDKTCN